MHEQAPGGPQPAVAGEGPLALYVGVVQGLPVEARFEERKACRRPGAEADQLVATGAVYRDSAGRERRDAHVRAGGRAEFELITIIDRAAGTLTVLQPAAKTAVTVPDMGDCPGGPGTISGAWMFRGPWFLHFGSEEKVIEGVACRKAVPVRHSVALAGAVGASGEVWVSDEVKLSVLEDVTDRAGEHHWRLFGIRRADPPAWLFEVPPDYMVVERSKFDGPRGG